MKEIFFILAILVSNENIINTMYIDSINYNEIVVSRCLKEKLEKHGELDIDEIHVVEKSELLVEKAKMCWEYESIFYEYSDSDYIIEIPDFINLENNDLPVSRIK